MKRFGQCKATRHNKEVISNTPLGVVRWCEKFRASRLHVCVCGVCVCVHVRVHVCVYVCGGGSVPMPSRSPTRTGCGTRRVSPEIAIALVQNLANSPSLPHLPLYPSRLQTSWYFLLCLMLNPCCTVKFPELWKQPQNVVDDPTISNVELPVSQTIDAATWNFKNFPEIMVIQWPAAAHLSSWAF